MNLPIATESRRFVASDFSTRAPQVLTGVRKFERMFRGFANNWQKGIVT
jgi:hypothetical protein